MLLIEILEDKHTSPEIIMQRIRSKIEGSDNANERNSSKGIWDRRLETYQKQLSAAEFGALVAKVGGYYVQPKLYDLKKPKDDRGFRPLALPDFDTRPYDRRGRKNPEKPKPFVYDVFS